MVVFRPENFPSQKEYRNPIISSVMRDLHYVSRFGRGIRTVKDELAANGNRPAEFGLSDIDGGCDGGHDDCILRCVEEREGHVENIHLKVANIQKAFIRE